METPDKEKKNSKKLKKDSAAYLRQIEKANAKKRKFLDKMTEQQKEIKRAKDREYYKKTKAENKVKKISDMTEREKRKQRKDWKKAFKKYREKKKRFSKSIILYAATIRRPKKQLSIHAGVYYLRSSNDDLKSKSFATVSDNLDHQAHAAWAHKKPMLTM